MTLPTLSEITRDPGYRWIVSPTTGWQPPAPDRFHWARYTPAGDGLAHRWHGFAPTRETAIALATLTKDERGA